MRNGKKPETAVCTGLKLLGPESGRGNYQTDKPCQTSQPPEQFSPGQQREGGQNDSYFQADFSQVKSVGFMLLGRDFFFKLLGLGFDVVLLVLVAFDFAAIFLFEFFCDPSVLWI